MKSLILPQLLASTALGAAISPKLVTRQEANAIWQPEVSAKIQMMISAVPKVDSSLVPKDVNIFDVDLFEAPAATVSALHDQGIKVICYFSAGTGENWRPDYSQFQPSDLGAGLPDWQGEKYLNLRSDNVLRIMQARIQKAADMGCDGIDPDNLDAYSNGGGGITPPLTQNDSAAFVKSLAAEARKYNMATGLKNAQQILSSVRDDVQFAVNEECVAVTKDCNLYDDFMAPADSSQVGKPVFHVEYVQHSGSRIWSTYDGFTNLSSDEVRAAYCLQSNPNESKLFSTFIKTLALDGWIMYCDGAASTTTSGGSN